MGQGFHPGGSTEVTSSPRKGARGTGDGGCQSKTGFRSSVDSNVGFVNYRLLGRSREVAEGRDLLVLDLRRGTGTLNSRFGLEKKETLSFLPWY